MQRMKKIIFGFFTLFLPVSTAMAFDCPSGATMTETSCNATAGCHYIAGSCKKCDSGKYSPANKNTCEDCSKPTDATFTGPGESSRTCPWRLTCAAGTYWNGSSCANCAGNQTSSASTITFNGTGSWPAANNTCTYKSVLVKLEKNQGVFDIDKEVYAKCGAGFSDNSNGPWREQPNITPTLWWGQTFYGYYTAKTGGTQRFKADGTLAYGTTACTFTAAETTLYAHWEQQPYYVEYYYGTETTPTSRQQCYLGNECSARAPDSSKAPAGQAFQAWKCEEGCTGNVNKGDKITEPAATNTTTAPIIKLRAVWAKCKSGYYCSNGKEEPCPIGSTSTEGNATAKSDCYITSATKFCDGPNESDCFTLPIGKVSYSGN